MIAARICRGLAIVAGLLSVAGCGSDTVDASKAEEGIESSSLSTATTQIKSASCPDNIEKQRGGTMICPTSVPVKVGTTTTCPVMTASGRQGTVSFEFSSNSGTVDPSSVKT